MATLTDTRFSRERLAGYDPKALARAAVLVVGAGALGQNLLVNLALSGVGELRIVDFDEFEEHNAPRSPLYPTAGEGARWGMAKSRVVAHKSFALARAGDIAVRYAEEPIQALGAGAFQGITAVAACVDNPEARAYLSDMCRWLGVTLIEGGFDGSAVTLSSFPALGPDASDAPCYRCGNPSLVGTFSCERQAAAAVEAGITPAIQAAAATLGGLQAEAVIQAAHGRHPTGLHRTNLDIRTGELLRYELAVDPGCQGVHRRLGEVTPIQVAATDRIGRLVEAIAEDLGPDCSIELPDRLVWDAFCNRCGKAVIVRAPDWAWRASPLCVACGGRSERYEEAPAGMTPTILPALGMDLPEEVLELPCLAAGLPALSVVEADNGGGGRGGAYRLGGDLDDLFSRVSKPSSPPL